jgi:hypothetical protein
MLILKWYAGPSLEGDLREFERSEKRTEREIDTQSIPPKSKS